MKKLLLLLSIATSFTATAQNNAPLKEGKAVYEHIVKLEGRFRGPEAEMPDRMPKQLTEHFELLFTNGRSLWQQLPDAAEEATAMNENGGNTMRLARWGGNADVVYCDLESGRKVEQNDLGTKTYLVEDTLSKLLWKIGDDEKVILGYNVKKATAFRYGTRRIMTMENGKMSPKELPDTSMLVAWFTTEIPVASGPHYSNQLPGLILELDENSGRSIYKAIEISPKVNRDGIKEPKGGKHISAADFRKEQQKIMAQMQQRMESGGRVSMPLPPGN